MDTDSFESSFTPITVLFIDLRQFSKDSDITEVDSVHEKYSKDSMKVIGKTKLEASPENDSDEAVLLEIKSIS